MSTWYQQLSHQLEIDRDLGVQFIQRDTNVAAPVEQEDPDLSKQQPLPGLELSGSAAEQLETIATAVAACTRCGLCEKRKNSVPGEGHAEAELMFIGEGPGADEDRQGRPFVGAAGQLLDKMINAMGFERSDVYIANIVKCRPPGNRTPEEDEAAACMPWLEQQINIIQPKIICTLGNTPLRALSGNPKAGITRMRGKEFMWQDIPVIPTFHPSYLLRNAEAKKPCWEDLKLVVSKLGRELP